MNSNIDSRGVIDASEPNHIDALRGEIGAAFSTSEYGDLNAEQERRVEQAIAIVKAYYDPLLAKARRAALASAPPPAVPDAVGVRVKGLTWEERPYAHCRWITSTSIGEYLLKPVVGGHYLKLFGEVVGFYPTVEEAHAAAQADFDRRILSSIEPTPSPEPQASNAVMADNVIDFSELDALFSQIPGGPYHTIHSDSGWEVRQIDVDPTNRQHWPFRLCQSVSGQMAVCDGATFEFIAAILNIWPTFRAALRAKPEAQAIVGMEAGQ